MRCLLLKHCVAKISRLSNAQMQRRLSLALLVSVVVSSNAQAISIEEFYTGIDQYKATYAGVEFPPPKVLLGEQGHKTFLRSIDRGFCGVALWKLGEAIGQKHPHLPHPTSDGLLAWELIYAPRHYPELFFCRAKNRFAEAYEQFNADGETPARFPQHEKNRIRWIHPSDKSWRLHAVISDLFHLAFAGYPPAFLELAKLSKVGGVVRLTPQYAYFALTRAKQSGLQDGALEELLQQAKQDLSGDELKRLEPRIESGTWPRSDPIVQD